MLRWHCHALTLPTFAALQAAKPRTVSPELARSAIRHHAAQPQYLQHLQHPQHLQHQQHDGGQGSLELPTGTPQSLPFEATSEAPALLDYCLADLVPEGGEQQQRRLVERLEGLPLLPLFSGGVATLQAR